MLYMFIAIALASVWAPVSAQSAENLPNCAVVCILDALAQTACKSTDFACACNQVTKIAPLVEPCARKSCSESDYAALPDSLDKFCAAAGVAVTVDASDSVLGVAPTTTPVAVVSSNSLTSESFTPTSSTSASLTSASLTSASSTSGKTISSRTTPTSTISGSMSSSQITSATTKISASSSANSSIDVQTANGAKSNGINIGAALAAIALAVL